LTDDEIKSFWQATAMVAAPLAQCLQLLLLTGCRRDEIGKLRRDEISADGTVITIPASRSKNKKPHVIPLSPLAREILASVQTTGDLVFVAGRGSTLPWSRIKSRLDAEMKSTGWRLHDVRRTVSTGLTALGVEPSVTEACLNHHSGTRSGVAGVYNQHHYLPEKTAALARWSDHVIGLVEGRTAKVVPIKRKGGGR
jgi:integrase